MKARIMFYLVLGLLLVIAGRSFGAEDLDQTSEGAKGFIQAYMVEEADSLIEPKGSEDSPSFTYYGLNAGLNSSGTDNAFFGYKAGENNTRSYSAFVGSLAGAGNQGAACCFFGYYSGKGNLGNSNSFFGAESGSGAGEKNPTGGNNTFIGYYVGLFNSSGSYNTFVGSESGFRNEAGEKNTFIGYQAGKMNTGNWNTFNGTQAGYSNTTGYWNTCMGFQAGYSATGSYNVFLGAKAGYKETGSYKLYIDPTDTETPLIWGDFDTNKVVINGGFRAIAISSPSDERLKRTLNHWNHLWIK